MPVYGLRPDDVVVDAAGNVQSGATITLHATQADAQAGTGAIATATTSGGRWSADVATAPVWVRTPSGSVYQIQDWASKADLPGANKNAITGWFHASGFGAKGDGATNDGPALQAAIDAADAAGGGVVYVPEKYRTTQALLLPSNVTLRGNNSGGQMGVTGSYSRIVYAGAAGGTVISPKVRTGDTVNWGLHGLKIDGGGLASILVELYRVSYSRLTDLALSGCQAGGVGVVFDANVNGQCYFNVTDNVKVDGVDTGVRFTRGANANRWQGGKIGNGAVGMEFLSLSAGNMIVATDLENSSSKHIYVDAASNVFMGLHMEIAPIGFDITANGLGTRRFGTTFATNVTSYVNNAATTSGSLDELTSDTYLGQVGATRLTSKSLSSTTQVNLDPLTLAGTASALLYMFRNVNTTGAKQFGIYKGDGTATLSFLFDILNGTLSVGDVGLGGMRGGLGLVNRTLAPTSNPVGGGVAYAEGGALKWRTSGGTIATVAGNVISTAISYAVGAGDRFILATSGSAGVTVTLPAAVLGARHVVKKVDAGTGAVTVATTSAQTIDGAATKVLATQYASVEVVSDGTSWFVV